MILLLAAYLGVTNLLSLDVTDNVEGVLSRVAKTTGQKFVVDREIGAMNVCVQVKDVGLDEFEKRLARLTRTTLTERAGIVSLKRTPAQTRKLAEERVTALTPPLEGQLAALRPGLEDQDVKEEAKALAKALRSAIAKDGEEKFVGPADALLNDLLRGMGAKRLAELPLFHNYQFSNQPAPAEATLPGAETIVPRFEAVSRAFADEVTEEAIQADLYKYEFERIVVAAHHTGQVGRVLLSLYGTFFSTSAIVCVFDSQGKEITSAAITFPRLYAERNVEIANGSEPIAWPDETNMAVTVLKKKQKPNGHEALVNRCLAEPLTLQVVPGLKAVASSRASQILSLVPDKSVITLFQRPPQTASSFANTLALGGIGLRVDGTWLIGDACPGYFDPAQYLNRSVFHRWVEATRTKSASWLRRFSELYARGDDAASNGITSWTQSTFWPILGVVEPPQITTRWALRALGSCSDFEWQEFERGNPISVAGPLDRIGNIDQWACQGPMVLEELNGSKVVDVEKIGTISFPAGPPENATIRLNSHSTHVVGINVDGKLLWMDMFQTANWVCVSGLPHPDTEETALKAMKGSFKLGLRPHGEIIVTLSPKLGLTADQPDGDIVTVSDSASIDNWPADYLSEFKAAVREFLTLGATNGKAPPPVR